MEKKINELKQKYEASSSNKSSQTEEHLDSPILSLATISPTPVRTALESPLSPRGFAFRPPSIAASADSSSCLHNPQCSLRQPVGPPFPSITFLMHEKSNYHLHMMTRPVDGFVGCFRCFSIENENYGCDKCTWLKWWFKWHGERHGFPDISPWIYEKYV